jgi:hypothetical protein
MKGTVLMLVFRGEESNLRILAKEIAEHPDLGRTCSTEIVPVDDGRHPNTLGHGDLAEIAVAIATGVATNAVTAALKLLVDRARDRGKVTTVQNDSQQVGDDSRRPDA